MNTESLQWLVNLTGKKNQMYVDNSVPQYEYYANDLGWRAPKGQKIWPQSWESSIVLVGCSQTFGVCVEYEETMAHYISELSGKQVINLGRAGTSIDRMWKTLIDIRKRGIRPFSIVVNWPDIYRYYEWHTGIDGFVTFDNPSRDEELYNFMSNNDHYNETYTEYMLESSRLLWASYTKWIEITWAKTMRKKVFPIDQVDLAGDGKHWGPKTHKVAAEHIIDQLKDSL
jgi:hypothetical protein